MDMRIDQTWQYNPTLGVKNLSSRGFLVRTNQLNNTAVPYD